MTLEVRNTTLKKINVVRYADGLIITGKTSEILSSVVRPWIEQFLRERGLTLSEEKTRITHIDDGFDFLGWNFRKYAGKLLVKPSADNIKRFYQKIRETVKNNMTTEQISLIHALNSKLRGWGGISSACCFESYFLSHGAPDIPVALAMGQKASPKQGGNMG